MARSLTVKHTETPGTSSLLNGFLVFAFGWLLISMLVAGATASPMDGPEPAAVLNAK
ncbi:MAG: hypothetical protein H6741_18565 [Alphaproteobacteria bacterium]|nr:hypothetical protein [Alphaproteobacteria bacterium]MCB9794719.1 hypothetical protein [Alphaproteobacteria bacterium]